MHPVPPLAPHSLLVYLAAIAVLLAVARLVGNRCYGGHLTLPAT